MAIPQSTFGKFRAPYAALVAHIVRELLRAVGVISAWLCVAVISAGWIDPRPDFRGAG